MSNNNQPPKPPAIEVGTELYYLSRENELPYRIKVTKVNKQTFATDGGDTYYLEPSYNEYRKEWEYRSRNTGAFGNRNPSAYLLTPEAEQFVRQQHKEYRLIMWFKRDLPTKRNSLTPDQIQQIKTLVEGFEKQNKTE